MMFPILIFLLYKLAAFSVLFVQEAEPSDFDDLGKLVFIGVGAAIILGLAVAFLRNKLVSSPDSGFLASHVYETRTPMTDEDPKP